MEGLRRCNDEPGSPMDDFYDDDIVVLPSQLRRPMQVLFASQMLGRSRTVQFFYSQGEYFDSIVAYFSYQAPDGMDSSVWERESNSQL